MYACTNVFTYLLSTIYIYISRHWWKRLCSSPFRGSSQEGADDTIISFGMFWTFQIIWHYSSFCNLRFAIQILTHRGILLLLLSPTYITYIYICRLKPARVGLICLFTRVSRCTCYVSLHLCFFAVIHGPRRLHGDLSCN